MYSNNQVVIEKDIYCPYCDADTAVLISETVGTKSVRGCAALGLKNGCLLTITGGCWAIVSGFPLTDVKEEFTNNIYGFCPHCVNTYPVIKPELKKKDVFDKFSDTKQSFANMAGKAKGMMGKNNNNDENNGQ